MDTTNKSVNLVDDTGTILGSIEVEILLVETKFEYPGRVNVYAQVAKRPHDWEPPDFELPDW